MLMQTGFEKVRHLLLGPYQWFPIKTVFPEAEKVILTTCETEDEMVRRGYELPGTILRPIALQITSNLRQRIQSAAFATLSTEERNRIDDATKNHRLIWINLRSHNKMWLSQVEGYVALLNTLQNEFGNLGVIYDGFTDTKSVRDAIDGQLNSKIARYDTIGNSMALSVCWAAAVKTFVSVVGSGLVINSWLVEKAGIAHANRPHLRQSIFWNNVSINSIPTIFIDPAVVQSDNLLYGNYDFDWRILLAPLRDILF
jgi:hypothetical protein